MSYEPWLEESIDTCVIFPAIEAKLREAQAEIKRLEAAQQHLVTREEFKSLEERQVEFEACHEPVISAVLQDCLDTIKARLANLEQLSHPAPILDSVLECKIDSLEARFEMHHDPERRGEKDDRRSYPTGRRRLGTDRRKKK